jgi:hypothetical protein
MRLLQTAFLMERYGLRLTLDQVAEVLGMSVGAVRNQISKRTFPIPTYSDQGRRWADAQDVAEYVDQCRQRAKAGEGAPA